MTRFTNAIKPALFVLFITIFCSNVNAQSGNVLDFDGINDYVDIPYNYSLSVSTISIQFWVRVNTNNGKTQAIITSGGTAGGYNGFEIAANPDGRWYIYVGQGSSNLISIQGPAISYGVWTNISATYDQSAVRLYVNGTLVNTVAVSGITPNPSPLPIRIGAANTEGAANAFLGGQLDELSFWNKVLTPAQISSNMNNPLAGNETSLLAYYNFNEGIANGDNTNPPVNTLIDATNRVNGTLHNFALNGTSSNWISLSALPVNLVSFSGTKKDGFNLLEWSTASEQNSRSFEIQRSVDGNDFSAIATVSAAGNSDRVLNYQYDDRSLAASPVYYYRLKMVDLDGAAKFSSIIFIKNAATLTTTVYPNPAIDHITINVSDKNLLNTSAVLSDLNGKVLQRISLTQTSTQVNVSSYTRGMYLLKFNDGTSIKIVKE